ncbi:MAG: alpha/beta hydrolase [Bacteroidota bacterium]
MEKEGQIDLENDQILKYKVFGAGKEYVFCFHGFGQNADVFKNLPLKLKDHTIISFDLPFHGNSSFPEEKLTRQKWKEISTILIDHFKIEQVALIAYSIGGRFVIRFAIDHPEVVKNVTFIAADGFHYTGIYRFATSLLGKSLFRSLLKKPDKLFAFSDQLARWGILNPSIVKFAKLQLGSKEQRIRVYNSWVYFKPLMTLQRELIDSVNNHQIPVKIYVGSKDNVIKPKYFNHIDRKSNYATVNILPKRHHEMIEGYIKYDDERSLQKQFD